MAVEILPNAGMLPSLLHEANRLTMKPVPFATIIPGAILEHFQLFGGFLLHYQVRATKRKAFFAHLGSWQGNGGKE